MSRLGKEADVPQRPAGDRRRVARHHPHGAGRQGQPRAGRAPSTATAPSPWASRARTPGSSSARRRDPELGFVGDVRPINPALLERLLAEGLIPVVATIGVDEDGPGLQHQRRHGRRRRRPGAGGREDHLPHRRRGPAPRRRRPRQPRLALLEPPSCACWSHEGVVIERHDPEGRGMPPRGREHGRLGPPVDGRRPHVLLLELFTDAGIGTMITRHPSRPARRPRPDHQPLRRHP